MYNPNKQASAEISQVQALVSRLEELEHILGIGAPFWGLVFGYLVSRVMERGDFATLAAT